MNKELEIWRFAARKLEKNEPVILLIVAESSGSSPGRQGFKMIVSADEICGSIGGGVMEANLVQSAKHKAQSSEKISALSTQRSALIEQVHRKNSPDSSGMICSGKQSVISVKLTSDNLKTIKNIIEVIENDYFLHLQIAPEIFRVVDLFKSKSTERGISKHSSVNFDYIFERFEDNDFIYEELLGFKNELFVIGGGHCALALSELMSKMDFRISLFDDRSDLNTIEKNKFVHAKKIIESYELIGEFIHSGNNVYVVVMTLGYKFDEIVIRKLFDKNFKYFGVLGSKAKMKTLLKTLEKEGFDKEKLAQIRTPIGLPINSHTPEEIAVSIAAEIIAVKNSKG